MWRKMISCCAEQLAMQSMLLFPPKPLAPFSVSSFSPSLSPPKTLTHRFPPKTLSKSLPFPWRSKTFLGVSSRCSPANSSSPGDELDVELDRLLALLPDEMSTRIRTHPQLRELIEVVLDLGRKPLARLPSGDLELSDTPITFEDLQFATSQVLIWRPWCDG